jgi:hypothetical protein
MAGECTFSCSYCVIDQPLHILSFCGMIWILAAHPPAVTGGCCCTCFTWTRCMPWPNWWCVKNLSGHRLLRWQHVHLAIPKNCLLLLPIALNIWKEAEGWRDVCFIPRFLVAYHDTLSWFSNSFLFFGHCLISSPLSAMSKDSNLPN